MIDTSIWLEWVLMYIIVYPLGDGTPGIEMHEKHEQVMISERACRHAKKQLRMMHLQGLIVLEGGQGRCVERLKEDANL